MNGSSTKSLEYLIFFHGIIVKLPFTPKLVRLTYCFSVVI
jgi:hypothetical protein